MGKENSGIKNSPLKELYIWAQLVYYNSSLKKSQDKQKPERKTLELTNIICKINYNHCIGPKCKRQEC